MKNKTLKKQRGGDLGQILGASALGAFLLWGVSKAGSRNESGAVYKMRTENLNSSELARELNGQDIGPSKKFMIEQPVVPPSNKSLVPPSNESVVLPSNESVVLPKKKNRIPTGLGNLSLSKNTKASVTSVPRGQPGSKGTKKRKEKEKEKEQKKGKGKEKEQKKGKGKTRKGYRKDNPP